jgi:hypothetical protein
LHYIGGIVSFTARRPTSLADKPFDQLGKLEEVRKRHERSPAADHEFGIGHDEIGPLRRHRGNPISVDAEQQPRAVSVVSLADADELPPAQRVEWVRDTHKSRRCVRTTSILW